MSHPYGIIGEDENNDDIAPLVLDIEEIDCNMSDIEEQNKTN